MRSRVRVWLARHAQTLIGSLGRIVQHPLAALSTMAVIAVALALPLLLGVVLQNCRAATANWTQIFDLSVYLDKKAAPTRAAALAEQLRSRTDIATVRVIGADQALAEFRESSGFGGALDALTDNPLPDTLLVTPALAASTPEGVQALEKSLSGIPDVQLVQVDTQWVNRLTSILGVLQRILWLIAALLGLGVVLVIGNTIRLDILNRRTEIEVIKLVGATDGFARRPFLYSGCWYGLGGGVLALAAVAVAVQLLTGPVDRLAGAYSSHFHLTGLGWRLGTLTLVGAVILSWLGAWFAATRHIRDIDPT